MFELNTYSVVVQKAMIFEGESDQAQREHEGKKRKFEQHRVIYNQGSSQGRFSKRLEFQDNWVGSFARQGTVNQGQVNRFQGNNQQNVIKPPIP